MNRTFKTGLAVVLAAGSLAALSAPAQAHDWNGGYGGGYYGGERHGDSTGAAIVGGVIGLALGAAIASSSHHDSYGYGSNDYRSGYGSNYYGSGYRSNAYGSGYGYTPNYGYGQSYGGDYDQSGYGYAQRQCVVRRQVWDGYEYEVRRVAVPC